MGCDKWFQMYDTAICNEKRSDSIFNLGMTKGCTSPLTGLMETYSVNKLARYFGVLVFRILKVKQEVK